MIKNKTWAWICFVLVFGHVFDLLMGIDAHKWFPPYKFLADIYAQWDPTYVAQDFYIKIVSLSSGFVMAPMAFFIGISFLRNRPNYPLMLFYAGWILATNLIWRWNEHFAPVPVANLWWTDGLFLPWIIFPIAMAVMAYKKIRQALVLVRD